MPASAQRCGIFSRVASHETVLWFIGCSARREKWRRLAFVLAGDISSAVILQTAKESFAQYLAQVSDLPLMLAARKGSEKWCVLP